MTHFLEGLDQWALEVLMVIYHLLGVQDLPKEPNPHWQVIERWAPQPDGHYRLILESTTIQDECRSGRAKYIIFPQTYLARQQIFADSIKVYTNEMDKEWHLSTVADRPVINCDLIKIANTIRFVDNSYLPFYASINNWPMVIRNYPTDQFIYNSLYFAIALSILFLTAVGSISLKIVEAEVGSFYQFGLASAILLFVQTPGVLLSIDIKLTHVLFFAALMYSVFYLLKEYTDKIDSKSEFFIHLYIIILSVLSFGLRNLTHLFVFFSAIFSILLIFLTIITLRKKDMASIFSLVLVMTLGANDFYQSQVSRSKNIGLAALAIAIMILVFYKIMSQALQSRKKILNYQKNIEIDKKVLQKTSEINTRMKQLIHDIKAPLTSLNFSIASTSFNPESLKLSIQRMNEIVKLQGQDQVDIGLDWYSVELLINILTDFEKEQRENLKKITVKLNAENYRNHDIFFDPQQFRGFIFELIFNACKNNIEQDINFIIECFLDNNYIVVECKDNGISKLDGEIANIGVKGYSKYSTGLGLSNIINRLEAWGGEASFLMKKNGFTVLLKMRKRIR